MVMRADQYKIISPGSPAPVTFGMDGSTQSMSLNPGTGSFGQIGDSSTSFGSQFSPGVGGGSGGGLPFDNRLNTSTSVGNVVPNHIQAPTLGTVQVNGYYGGGGGYDLGSLGGFGLGGSGTVGGSQQGSGQIPVKNLAPVKVTAQLPRTPGWYEGLWMRENDLRNDHPYTYNAAKAFIGSAVPILPTVHAIANAYQRWKHGMPLFGKTMGNLGGTVSDIFNGIGSGPGGPLSSNDQNPLYKDLDSSFFNGSGSGATTGGGSGYYDSQLPNYPGLASISAYPLSGDMGGYWNQMAIHDAAPTYGPFAGFGKKPLPIAPAGILGT